MQQPKAAERLRRLTALPPRPNLTQGALSQLPRGRTLMPPGGSCSPPTPPRRLSRVPRSNPLRSPGGGAELPGLRGGMRPTPGGPGPTGEVQLWPLQGPRRGAPRPGLGSLRLCGGGGGGGRLACREGEPGVYMRKTNRSVMRANKKGDGENRQGMESSVKAVRRRHTPL